MADDVIEVVVGTYNHAIIGLQFIKQENNEKEWHFVPRFTDQGHDGCVKTVSASEKFLASGSTDETIRLYDLRKHVELGSLAQQSGSITSLAFSGNLHMLSASEDGTICIWKCKSWECLKTLKGHRDAVTSISVHPSGRLALSVSKDKTIRTWNLLTGRSAYTTSIKQVADIVVWSPSGDSYVVASGSKATINKISDASNVKTIDCLKTILAVDFLTPEVLVLAGEAEEITVYDFNKEETLQKFKAHDVRVKAIQCIIHPDNEAFVVLFTVASDGSLKAWRFSKENLTESPVLLAELFIPGRPVCMTVRKQGKTSKKDERAKKSKPNTEKQSTDQEVMAVENSHTDDVIPDDANAEKDACIQANDTVVMEGKKSSLGTNSKKLKREQGHAEKKKQKKKKKMEADDG
eukprot:gene7249-8057_t